MKRYTVKEVVTLENKAKYLSKLDRERLADDLFFPLILLFNMGLASYSLYFTGENQTIAPLIIGGTSQLLGGGLYGYFASASKRLGNLRDKLSKIYKTMGKDFEDKVTEEVWNQEFGSSSRTK